MNNIALEIWDDEGSKVTFYTVRQEGASQTETDKFFLRFENDPDFEEPINELTSLLLYTIGDDYGAISSFFNRQKNQITGLPHHGKVTLDDITFYFPEFPLRLYALRINDREDLVMLFNGGIKNARTDQESEDLSLKFNEAMHFAKRIEDALSDGMIIIDEENRRLLAYNGSKEIIL